MKKQKQLFLISLLSLAGLLTYTWTVLLFTDPLATWRHYIGLMLFAVVLFLYTRNFAKAVVATGIYLILATCNLLALTPSITTTRFGLNIGPDGLYTPPFQLLSLGIFIAYFFINLKALIHIQLDYQEAKALRMQNKT
ncbi:MAG TPA: hypothetical protein VGE66_08720 [Chitinophagaceae bacterium]